MFPKYESSFKKSLIALINFKIKKLHHLGILYILVLIDCVSTKLGIATDNYVLSNDFEKISIGLI